MLPQHNKGWNDTTKLHFVIREGKTPKTEKNTYAETHIDTEQMGINQSFINVGWQHPLEVVNSATSSPSSLHRKELDLAVQKSNPAFLNFSTEEYCTYFHSSKIFVSSCPEIMKCQSISQKAPLFNFIMREMDTGNA